MSSFAYCFAIVIALTTLFDGIYSEEECSKFVHHLHKVIHRNPVKEYTDANLVVWRRHNSEFQALDLWFYQDLKDSVYENALYEGKLKTKMREVMEIGLDAIELFEEREVRRLTGVVGSYVKTVYDAMAPVWDVTVKDWVKTSEAKQGRFSKKNEAERIQGMLQELEGDDETSFTKKSALKVADYTAKAMEEAARKPAPSSVPRKAYIKGGAKPEDDDEEDDLFDEGPATTAAPAASAASKTAPASHITVPGYPEKFIETFCEETKIAIAGFKAAFKTFAGHYFQGAGFTGMKAATVAGSTLPEKQASAKGILYAEYFYRHMNSLRQSDLRKFTGNQVNTLNEVEDIRIKLAKIGAKIVPTEVSQLKVSWTYICVLHGNCK